MNVESPICHNHLNQQQQQHQQQHQQQQQQQQQQPIIFRRNRLQTSSTKRNKSHSTIIKNNNNNNSQHTATATPATTTTTGAATKTDKVLPLFEGQSFPFRLWYLVNHEYYDDVIKWSEDGNYVIIMSESCFEQKVFIHFLLLLLLFKNELST